VHHSRCRVSQTPAGQTQRLLLRACPHRRRLVARCSEPGSGGVGVTVHPACHPGHRPSCFDRLHWNPAPVALPPPSSIVLADCSAGKGSPGHVAGCIVLLVGQRSGVRRGDWLRCRCVVSSANSPEVRSGAASVRASEERRLQGSGRTGLSHSHD
jgi:hypothetical protein